MRIVAKSTLQDFWEVHPDAEGPLRAWIRVASRETWRNFGDVRAVYSHADRVGKYTVINIGGRKFRLVIHIHFQTSIIFIHRMLTHKDDDDGGWKDE